MLFMKTLRQLANARQLPTTTAWYLADLGEARGRQQLFIKQSPQRLNVLREHALIESAVSSNRIEGVTIEQSRVKAVVLGKSLLHDRDEEEIRGYRDALTLIHINYILYILKLAYREFEERVGLATTRRSAKKK